MHAIRARERERAFKMHREKKKRREGGKANKKAKKEEGKKGQEDFFYIPVPGIDPGSFSRVVIDKVHLPVEVLGDVPSFRKRYLPIPSPWHISLRSKSIQNLSLYRRAVDGRISVRAYTRFAGRIYQFSISLSSLVARPP